jgi:hypothetical protein
MNTAFVVKWGCPIIFIFANILICLNFLFILWYPFPVQIRIVLKVHFCKGTIMSSFNEKFLLWAMFWVLMLYFYNLISIRRFIFDWLPFWRFRGALYFLFRLNIWPFQSLNIINLIRTYISFRHIGKYFSLIFSFALNSFHELVRKSRRVRHT